MVYVVMDQQGKSHLMSADELYGRIWEDSNMSNYGWLASATELVRVTGRPFFNDYYAIEIRSSILKRLATLEHERSCGGGDYVPCKEERRAAQECYNSLFQVKEESALRGRQRYLRAMIDAATRAETCFDFIAHPGKSFQIFHDRWVKAKYAEYAEKEFIDFEELHEVLRAEWLKLKKEAEERGDFEADDEEARMKLVGKDSKLQG